MTPERTDFVALVNAHAEAFITLADEQHGRDDARIEKARMRCYEAENRLLRAILRVVA